MCDWFGFGFCGRKEEFSGSDRDDPFGLKNFQEQRKTQAENGATNSDSANDHVESKKDESQTFFLFSDWPLCPGGHYWFDQRRVAAAMWGRPPETEKNKFM